MELPKWTSRAKIPKGENVRLYLYEYGNIFELARLMDSRVKSEIVQGYWELITELFESCYELAENPCILTEGLKIIHDDVVDILLKPSISYAQLVNYLLLAWSEAMRLCSQYVYELANSELD